ncbi:MAG: thiamine pyrophosphate-dependent enzyme, partial [Planctomycetota bacterium]|nr:thiamine pyrophosphate-dependent enzyme [Planctomycetota bacterium]
MTEEKAPATNALGLTKAEYKGVPSTMCKGCGHDRISEAIIQASYDLGVDARTIIKMSGIGCSSKTPAYFLSQSMGINSTHGRMPSFATGAHVANASMTPVGVSGDGDTASIGMGQFVHMIRRNPKLVYIVENNGVYGLTKGQFSATADRESPSKRGAFPREESIDLCGMALELGSTFVARSFSGDKKQLVPLLKAALSFEGVAFIDVISPCVTFNNHEGSTKSYTHQKEMGV